MARINKTRYALLGIVAQSPKNAYEVKKTIEQTIGFFWQESFGQIYPILKQLEKEGCLKSSKEKKRTGPESTIYKITPKGKKELKEWLEKPVENFPYRNELLLKLFFGNHVEKEILIGHLQHTKEEVQRLTEIYANIRNFLDQHENPKVNKMLSLITLDFGIATAKSFMEWAEESKNKIKNSDF
ncbi:PadR family transcriptional regulator [Leptospira yasudae]|uniref:PadR family transcriptional regulator n=1 Tax=Leptospira yasudae TaxID=2202201 RepID=A0ABX9M062_9LEPT|nr:PadR family transcriptional regulator [Leptospira yasudae]RHX78606.1 PadR family transcriptional regulator [Leptospira yasudae]RHX91497.1 PadR family transcriptional regulator [Leptospira yasudae]TGK27714.1 PadR family transcriptional regulator [Leptospira yasudae]TGM06838.1 PadR family transcriptional regulator [Leptospira yasudae]